MKLRNILEKIEYISCESTQDPEIREITNNSSEVKKGDIFVCIEGFKTDGHNFAEKAVSNGASCVVASKPLHGISIPVIYVNDTRIALAQCSKLIYNDPSSRLKVIGITGTNGKTTVCYLIKSILEAAGKSVGLIGTNETIVGNTHVPAMRTTPEAHQLNKLFSDMLDMGAEYCVMEISSHSLELHRVDCITFEAAAFTNLTHDHLDFHKTMEGYFLAKAKLFDLSKIGVINLDSDWGEKFAEKVKGKLITYSIEKPSMNKVENVVLHSSGNEFELGGTHFKMRIPGMFSVYNGTAAICVCRALGIDDDAVAKGLSTSTGAKGRVEVVDVPADFKVIIDYAHTPDGLLNVLTTLKKFASGRIICVFGAAGERDSAKRPEMGKIVGTYADFAIITADNPINENLELICSQVEEGMRQTNCGYRVIFDRETAINFALGSAGQNDIVLLAGKGHETYQLIGNDKVPFSERKIVEKFFVI
ncbi:MAG: UDP-N-acetylmuramoyl-L-alanyl-D-glutamate--2,6-diaminopimelate ligase [Bacillota bacterium]|nr:UDP-N-acetylmuramoyl-L-alanyl-D-glutamate--2,6-diaminopimelate ligase [Bacillota bacterium]